MNKKYKKIDISSLTNNNNNYLFSKTNTNINRNKNTYFNLNIKSKKINYNWSNLSKHFTSEPNHNNINKKNSHSLKNNKKNISNNKNGYKKNNIIINIINNNKNNNYNSYNNNFSNYTSNNNVNDNKKNNSNNKNNLNICNYYSNNNINNNNDNNTENMRKKKKKNNNFNKKNVNTKKIIINNNNIIKGNISSKGLTVQNSKINNKSVNITNIANITNKQNKKIKSIKAKLLATQLNTDLLSNESNLIRNLTDRIKKQSLSNSIKRGKDQSIKKKKIFSKKSKKMAKTDLLDEKNEINMYTNNKSINRQILKNINLTNSNRPKKDISLVNKRIFNYHYNLNSKSNINIKISTKMNTHNDSKNKTQINPKYIRHVLGNSPNLTSIGIISKVSPLHIKEINKKKRVILPVNKTETVSRNHSKDKIYIISNSSIKRKYLESFSPKSSKEIIYKKINKIHNKNNTAIISSFLKNVNSNINIKNMKIKRNYYQNMNITSLNNSCKYKDLLKKINSNN